MRERIARESHELGLGMHKIGIDIGGTFTDIVVYDHAAGRRFSRKELTTHDDPARGVMTGVARLLAEDGVPADGIGRVVHATTLFTNALIERKGAVTGLITTEGFADTLEIGRERKFDLYDINIAKPDVLVPRNLRLEVPERLRHDGRVATPLDLDALDRAAERLVAEGCESVAVVFLHSYADPAHERQATARIEATHPALAVSASTDVAPEVREYERALTTVMCTIVGPQMAAYLVGFGGLVERLGIPAPVEVMIVVPGAVGIWSADTREPA